MKDHPAIFKGDVWPSRRTSALVRLLDRNHHNKSVAVQIPYDAGLARIQFTGENSFPTRERTSAENVGYKNNAEELFNYIHMKFLNIDVSD